MFANVTTNPPQSAIMAIVANQSHRNNEGKPLSSVGIQVLKPTRIKGNKFSFKVRLCRDVVEQVFLTADRTLPVCSKFQTLPLQRFVAKVSETHEDKELYSYGRVVYDELICQHPTSPHTMWLALPAFCDRHMFNAEVVVELETVPAPAETRHLLGDHLPPDIAGIVTEYGCADHPCPQNLRLLARCRVFDWYVVGTPHAANDSYSRGYHSMEKTSIPTHPGVFNILPDTRLNSALMRMNVFFFADTDGQELVSKMSTAQDPPFGTMRVLTASPTRPWNPADCESPMYWEHQDRMIHGEQVGSCEGNAARFTCTFTQPPTDWGCHSSVDFEEIVQDGQSKFVVGGVTDLSKYSALQSSRIENLELHITDVEGNPFTGRILVVFETLTNMRLYA